MDLTEKVFYGGDYNPEQWPQEVWSEDLRLFDLAHVSMVTLNVFSWTLSQPAENHYDFSWLDEIVALLKKKKIAICMATSTAAVPAWLVKKYPEVLVTDFQNRQQKFGRRHNFCPNSPVYRHFAQQLVAHLVAHYQDEKDILMWHVNNEYGNRCYCEHCQQAFRQWLKEKYQTLEQLNAAWNTRFWNHTFLAWDEIVLPNGLSEHSNVDLTAFPAISIDYDRFNSDSFLQCFTLEKETIKKVLPEAIVTTNFQSNGTYKPLDYFKWAQAEDVVSLDIYPDTTTSSASIAMRYDLMRGLKGGKSFQLMESCPTALNWKPQNPLKRPGMVRLYSYQALAHGADSILYFQMRKSRGAFEKFHGALIEHAGHEKTRSFQECAVLGKELAKFGSSFVTGESPAKVAFLFDWENWWGIEHSSGPTDQLKYLNEVQKYYEAFYQQNIPVDFVSQTADFSAYQVIVAPVLYMVTDELAAKLTAFTQNGGTFLTTYFSGIVDEHDLVTLGGYPGKLRHLLGIWVEEWDALLPEQKNRVTIQGKNQEPAQQYVARIMCEIIHEEGAEVIGRYATDFYQGVAAVTCNHFGQGQAWYVGAGLEEAYLKRLAQEICASREITAPLQVPAGVEVTKRRKGVTDFYFVLNHRHEAVTIPCPFTCENLLTDQAVENSFVLGAKDVAILKKIPM